jgi:hypothetical protein
MNLGTIWTGLGIGSCGPRGGRHEAGHRLIRTLGWTGLNLGINRDAPWLILHQPRGVLYGSRLWLDGECVPTVSAGF